MQMKFWSNLLRERLGPANIFKYRYPIIIGVAVLLIIAIIW